ncbi:MAG TPA: nickel pincer cofactor biosynthesis protein LarB [Frankiaceae bacterium]|nr:nickel pincer cofactor biosynthesis protein LarB [Frankiaceae bacterium]
MDRTEVRALLEQVAQGEVAPDVATERLASGPLAGVHDIGFARVDTHRALRTGDPEVVYGAGKTPSQIVEIVAALQAGDSARPALVTRAGPGAVGALEARWPDATVAGSTVVIGTPPPPRGRVAIISAGTSDAPVAAEAAMTVGVFGSEAVRISDVGVAGLHRVLAAREEFADADCLIVIAGMEGALPSVVGGLTGLPLIAVPTSVGYGASFGGIAALLAMLNSCAPGVAVCNIDNGFGAGVLAARIARQSGTFR